MKRERKPYRYPEFTPQELAREQWRAVPGTPLEVSTLGRVRSNAWPGRSYLLNPYPNQQKYLSVGWRETLPDGTRVRRSALVHRLVLEAFVGPCPQGQQGRHVDDWNPQNNRLRNLLWGTPRENFEDSRRHGRNRGAGKLTEHEVREIADRLRRGEPHRKLAAHYGVSQVAITHINKGRSYPHLTGGPIRPRRAESVPPGSAMLRVHATVEKLPGRFKVADVVKQLTVMHPGYLSKALRKLAGRGVLETELDRHGERVYWRAGTEPVQGESAAG